MSSYGVTVEVAGPLAMFTRPDTGGTPTSYPAPTWSAAKAIFESIAMLRSGDAWIRPTMVEICKRKGTLGGSSLLAQECGLIPHQCRTAETAAMSLLAQECG